MKNIAPPESMPAKKTENWHALSADEVLEHLKVQDNGLTVEEASARMAQYGPNQLSEAQRPGFLKLLWDQFNNFIVILLIVAALISALLGEWIDASAILAIVVLNAVLGIVQERRAEEALAALQKLAAPEAHVMRAGKRTTVPARELVPGDIVFLEAGNHIPADLRLLEAFNLQIEEAALTGESLPVNKNAAMKLEKNIPLGDRRNTAFMGTTVTYGRGRGVVVGTGMRSQLGLIAKMLEGVDREDTPLQQRLDQLGKTLGWGALAICALVFIVAVLRNTDLAIISAAGWRSFSIFKRRQKTDRGYVHAGSWAGDSRSARRTSRSGNDNPGPGHARNDPAARSHPPSLIGGDTWLGYRDMLRQNGNPHAE